MRQILNLKLKQRNHRLSLGSRERPETKAGEFKFCNFVWKAGNHDILIVQKQAHRQRGPQCDISGRLQEMISGLKCSCQKPNIRFVDTNDWQNVP